MSADPFKIFICYAREDKTPLEELMGHLAVFERNGTAKFWYDQDITGGKDWDQEIRLNLKDADIVLLLISPYFFRSDYIHSVELTEALQRDRNGEALVVPIILSKCLWYKHPELARLQALPSEAKPVYDKSKWPEHHDGLYDVAEGVDRILDDSDTVNRRTRKKQRLKELEEVQAVEQEQVRAEAATRAQQEQARARAEAEAAEAVRQAEEAARRQGLPGMVTVKGGTFQMGSEDGKGGHAVTLSDFEIGKYPVTQKWWMDIMGQNPSYYEGEDLPVENVSWKDVKDFLEKLNARFTGMDYRLPTEAEWEYAARGGEKGAKDKYDYAGGNELDELGWYSINSGGETHPVGRKKPNQLGLYDMSGNVWEWCQDWYGDYPTGSQTNPAGPTSGSDRVIRGGSWSDDPTSCRVAVRGGNSPGLRLDILGFRLARTF